MYVVQRCPGPAVAPFVDVMGYFAVDGPDVRERVIPTGGLQLLVNLQEDELRTYDEDGAGTVHRSGGAVLQGAQSQPQVIDTRQQRAIVLVSFTPGGAYPFFAAPPSATAGHLVSLDDLWGRDGEVLRERLLEVRDDPRELLRRLEQILVERSARPMEPDHGMRHAATALEVGFRVTDVADQLGIGTRSLARRFTEQVGLTPKRFARVRRFQRALASLPADGPPDWARVAAECGYYDQSHLIRDFHDFAGLSPSAYVAHAPREQNHVPLHPDRARPAAVPEHAAT